MYDQQLHKKIQILIGLCLNVMDILTTCDICKDEK